MKLFESPQQAASAGQGAFLGVEEGQRKGHVQHLCQALHSSCVNGSANLLKTVSLFSFSR